MREEPKLGRPGLYLSMFAVLAAASQRLRQLSGCQSGLFSCAGAPVRVRRVWAEPLAFIVKISVSLAYGSPTAILSALWKTI